MDVDYETYAEGEALLGWLNATVRLDSAAEPFDGNALLVALGRQIQSRPARARRRGGPPEDDADAGRGERPGGGQPGAQRREPELSHALQEPLRGGQLIVNLRAEAEPELLRAVRDGGVGRGAARAVDCAIEVEHLESFRPGQADADAPAGGGLRAERRVSQVAARGLRLHVPESVLHGHSCPRGSTCTPGM